MNQLIFANISGIVLSGAHKGASSIFATSYASSCLFLKEQINKHPFKKNGFVIGGTKFPFAEKNRRMGTDLGIRYFIS